MDVKRYAILGLVLFMSICCDKPKVVPMDGDTYLVQERSAQVGFGPPEGAKAEVYQIANNFCASQNKVVETVSFNMVDSGFARPGSVSLQFRCVASPSPTKPMSSSSPEDGKPDVFKKLDDLKKLFDRGLITQEDYERKKKEILDKL